jgi:hypothetical protein
MSERALPDGFADLERFVPDWVRPDAEHRLAKRLATDMADIKHFYAALLARGEAVLACLRGYKLGALPPGGENLLRLMLMLAEVAPAVEWYDNQCVTDGFPVERLRYLHQIPDLAPQL